VLVRPGAHSHRENHPAYARECDFTVETSRPDKFLVRRVVESPHEAEKTPGSGTGSNH